MSSCDHMKVDTKSWIHGELDQKDASVDPHVMYSGENFLESSHYVIVDEKEIYMSGDFIETLLTFFASFEYSISRSQLNWYLFAVHSV